MAILALILGAPGNKGESRRRSFGHVLNTYPDIWYLLTADDPNKEDPFAICQKLPVTSTVVRIIVDRGRSLIKAMSETTDSKMLWLLRVKECRCFPNLVNGKRDNYVGDIEVAKKYL